MKTQSINSSKWINVSDGSLEGIITSNSKFLVSIGSSSNVEFYHTTDFFEIKKGMGVFVRNVDISNNIIVSTYSEGEVIKSVTGVSISESSLTLEKNKTHQLTATVSPADATDKTVTWSSSDTSIATVDASGLVTATDKKGSVSITVKTNDGSFTKSCDITVVDEIIEVTGITLNATGKNLAVNDTFQLVATVSPDNATDKTVTWSSSDTSIATVDGSGLVKGIKASDTAVVITAKTNNNKTATCNFSIVA